MNRVRGCRFGGLAAVVLLATPVAGWAQSGAIGGAVRDTTQAALPGVTVEAASPALIEKVRAATTDGQGRYLIADLRPGVYVVTFRLSGFSTVRREGIELSAGQTVNVGADMTVGAVEETITVSGQTPLVDVQNVTQARVVTSDVIEALPTGRTAVAGFAALIPAATVSTSASAATTTQDVGGTLGNRVTLTSVSGSNPDESTYFVDGMRTHNLTREGGGTANIWQVNPGMVEQVVIELGGHSTESMLSGAKVNVILRDGGNTFRGSLFGNFTNADLQASNITPELQAFGITNLPANESIWEINPSLGGPLLRDRVWFFGSYRKGEVNIVQPGSFYAKDPRALVYEPDLSRPGISDDRFRYAGGRVTWQASPRNKLSLFVDSQDTCWCHYNVSSTTTPEGAFRSHFGLDDRPNLMTQVSFNSPVTNRLLIESGVTATRLGWYLGNAEGVDTTVFSRRDLGTGLTWGATFNSGSSDYLNVNGRTKISYVTGSHAFSVGTDFLHGWYRQSNDPNHAMQLMFRNGAPVSVDVRTTPSVIQSNVRLQLGLYAQEKWTIDRTTLNLGFRFDYLNVYIPAHDLPPVKFVGRRQFEQIEDVPNWKDISPRFGVSHDLFGDGRTAVKFSFNKYLQANYASLSGALNPISTSVSNTTRPWRDLNGDLFAQEEELGPLANPNFGRTTIVTTYDPDYLRGWGIREHDWSTEVGVQHQLLPGVSASVDYVRHWWGNFLVNDNLLVSPSDYTSFCVTAPADPRLPGGGGNQICGFYDINEDARTRLQHFVTFADEYGNVTDNYTGVNASFNVRLPRGINVQGGTSTGRHLVDVCDLAGKTDPAIGTVGTASGGSVGRQRNPGGVSPPSTVFCRVDPPYQTSFKALGTFPLPWWGLMTSATFTNVPGPQITASYTATNAQVAPSLGRNLSGGATVVTVPLVAPGDLYADRASRIDLRVAKSFVAGRTRLQALVDFYNLLNATSVYSLNNTFGSAWQRPTVVSPGFFVKFGVQANF